MEIRPLTPDTFAALERLFLEGDAPSWCWCMSFRLTASEWKSNGSEENHRCLHRLVEASDRHPPGLLALREDRAVGWVSVGPRDEFVRLQRSTVHPRIDQKPVWSIVCFVVSRRYRGEGLMHELLEAAVKYAGSKGAFALEAYPSNSAGRVPPSQGYAGFRELYEAAGFEVVASERATRSATPRLTMRLPLPADG